MALHFFSFRCNPDATRMLQGQGLSKNSNKGSIGRQCVFCVRQNTQQVFFLPLCVR